jgi:hypothetical protein
MTRGDDAPAIEARTELAAQYTVECKSQVMDAVDGLSVVGRVLQTRGQRKRTAAAPQAAVAADMLQVQAGKALAGPMRAEIGIAVARAAQPMREDDQWHRLLGGGGSRQIEPRRHRPASGTVGPVEVDRLIGQFLGLQAAGAWLGSHSCAVIERTASGSSCVAPWPAAA